jgi:hypothetical protein
VTVRVLCQVIELMGAFGPTALIGVSPAAPGEVGITMTLTRRGPS